MTLLGDVLGKWNTLRGEKYSSDLAGGAILCGERDTLLELLVVICWRSLVGLEVLINFAGG